MKSMTVVAALLIVATTGATTASAAPAAPRATASTVVLVDGGGDVWTFSNTTLGTTLAARPDADVLRARIAMGNHALHIRMKYDNLRREATQWYRATVRTKDASYWYVLEARKGHWSGMMFLDDQGEWVPETRVGYQIDYATDVVTLRIPYTSLGNPAWVQVRLRNDLGLPDHNTYFADNPTTHSEREVFTGRLGLPS